MKLIQTVLTSILTLVLLIDFTGPAVAEPAARQAVVKASPQPDAQPSPQASAEPGSAPSSGPSVEPSPSPSKSSGKSASESSAESTSESIKRRSQDDDEALEPLPSASPPQDDEKSPWLAAGFSLLLPGSGQMYVEERVWPEILITAGIGLAVAAWVVFDQLRAGSIKERVISGLTVRRADAQWDALTLLMQITVPSLWLWNAGDAFHRAEKFGEKVTGELDSHTNAYIIEENLVSVTLWQF